MRIALAMILSSIPFCGAFAHNLAADAGLQAQLGHQLTGAHHWPLFILLIGLALVSLRLLRRRCALRARTGTAHVRAKSQST